MDPKSLFETLAQYGVIGIMLFVVAYAYYRKDKRLDDNNTEWQKRFDDLNAEWKERLDRESSDRIEDSARYNKNITDMAEKVFQAVQKCSDVSEFLQRHHDRHEAQERQLPEQRNPRQTGPQRPVR